MRLRYVFTTEARSTQRFDKKIYQKYVPIDLANRLKVIATCPPCKQGEAGGAERSNPMQSIVPSKVEGSLD
jgi:hypothetical protein